MTNFHIFLLYVISFLLVTTYAINITLDNVLECAKSLPSTPPDLSSLWIANTTETCLYVTIQDQFGDGWSNNSNLFYWAQVGDEDTNIVSVGLDCSDDCGSIKSGCISPVLFEEDNEHFLHFTVVSIGEENQLSLPDYYWEMQWSVQIVKGEEWREKYYGGFNSSMVFNYNQEADDLALAWSENLWYYPPVSASCSDSAITTPEEFFDRVRNNDQIGHETYSYGFTSNDTFLESTYSITKLPESTLERLGWTTCLGEDDPVKDLYPDSFAFRSSTLRNDSSSAWNFCGFSGVGNEELGFAISSDEKCSGQYFGSVSDFCANAVTSFPSEVPTAAPTISEALSFYNSFDSSTLVQNAPAFSVDSVSSGNSVVFSYNINEVSDFENVKELWDDFISNYLVSDFDVEYSSFTVWASYLKYGSSTTVEWFQECSNNKLSNDLISAVLSGDTATTHQSCDHIEYMSSINNFCVGCETDVAFSDKCSMVESGMVSIPTNTGCYSSGASVPISKHAIVIEVFLREAVAPTVPTLHSVDLNSLQESVSISANITTTSTGGLLFCRAWEVSLNAIPTRALIKSSGVKSSIPSSLSNDNFITDTSIANLVPVTDYTVYCFTEDSLGNQMSEEIITSLGESVTTTCCRNLKFTDSPTSIRLGSESVVVTPSEFQFNLPIFPASNIVVTPTFFSQSTNAQVHSLTALKSSFVFDSSTSHLGQSRSFVVEPTTEGSFYVRLEISGDDAEEVAKYAYCDAFFEVIPVSGVLPAPTLDTAFFSDDGGRVFLKFAEPTDFGLGAVNYDANGVWDCSLFLSFIGSSYTACSWQSDDVVLLTFCGNSLCSDVQDRKSLDLLTPGGNITLKKGMIRAKCVSNDPEDCQRNNATIAPLVALVNRPQNPLVPNVFLSGSNPGGSCESPLFVDGTSSTGAGGRAWNNIIWSVSIDSVGEGNVTSEMLDSAATIQTMLNEDDFDYPLEISYSLLHPIRYAITLQLENFLLESSLASIFVDLLPGAESTGEIVSKPSVRVDGSSYRRIYSYDSITLSVSLEVPSCVSGNNTVYKWSVYRDISYQPHIKSLSANPKVMRLDPYTLSAGYSYRIQVTATMESGASDTKMFNVDVVDGSVYIKINGPDRVFLPVYSTWTLDASDSVLEDVSPLSTSNDWTPMLSWSCTVKSTTSTGLSYGDDCENIFNAAVSSPLSATTLIPLRTEIMLPGGVYYIVASAYSSSGEYVSSSVEIEIGNVAADVAPTVTITSSFRKFNADRILQLFGSVTAPVAAIDDQANVTMTWGVYDIDDVPVDFGMSWEEMFSTPQRKINSVERISSNTDSAVSLSLSALPSVFTPGTEYAFRLSAEFAGASFFASTTLIANSPPSSGKLNIVPSAGLSMSTKFRWNTLYWTDDVTDFPLLYTFKYSLKQSLALAESTSQPSIIGLGSYKSYLTSLLPPGKLSAGSVVHCAVEVSDIFGAAAEASTDVIVEEGDSIEISFANFSDSINSAVARMDWNSVAQDVSNAAALISLSDCQHAPDCDSLYRYGCGSTTPPHMCGECIVGYEGLAGSSNVACFLPNPSAVAGEADVGSYCSANSDCRYEICTDSICVYPTKTCPSANDDVCSGNGICDFYNDATSNKLVSSNGNPLPCSEDDTSCSARCSCSEGAYGKACSLSEEQYSNRSSTRELICESLQHVSANHDESMELANFLATTAATSFDPSEVLSTTGITNCLAILATLNSISDNGHLRNEALVQSNASSASLSSSVQDNYAVLISSFLDTLAFLNSSSLSKDYVSMDDVVTLVSDIEAVVSDAATSLSRAINSNMVPGEKSLEVLTAGVRMKVSYDSYDDLQGALLAPPLTTEELQYNTPLSTIILPSSGLASCTEDEDQSNGDKYARLSIMQWGSNPYAAMNSTMNTTTVENVVNSTNATAPELMSRILRFTPMVSSSEVGTGETSAAITDPYTLVLQYSTKQNWTAAKPGCGQFGDGTAASCPCNVSFYDEFSVTLECYNLLDFCPPVVASAADKSSRRKLAEHQGHGGDTRHPHYYFEFNDQRRRRLDFDYGGAADDDAAPSGSLLEYGAMFVSLGDEMASTLSSNPFHSLRDVEAAKPVLIMMSFLLFTIAAGYIICSRWDRYDRLYTKYVMNTTADKRYKRPKVLNLRDAFMEKTFVTQKRKSKLTFRDLGSKMRDEKDAQSYAGKSSQVDQESNLYFDTVYNDQFMDECNTDEDVTDYIPTLSTIKEQTDDKSDLLKNSLNFDKLGHKIATFFDAAMPATTLLERSNGWTRFMRAIMREHDWARIFTYSSLRMPRTIRFLVVVTDVLLLLFADSVFYGVLFPDDGTCTAYDNTNAEDCMAEPSGFVAGESMCLWDEEKSICELRPPPTSIEFYMIVAIAVTTASVGPQGFCHILLEEICALEPVFFGKLTRHDNTVANQFADSDSDDNSIELAPNVLDDKWEKAKDKHMFYDDFDTKKLYQRFSYYDYTTAEEEAAMLLRFISSSLESRSKCAPIPWRHDRKPIDGLSAANLEAIMGQLGVHADGSPVQLSWVKRFLCGTTPRDRVVGKIRRARRGVDRILDAIDSFTEEQDEYKETTLIHYFILEHFTPYKRYALKHQFFQFDKAEPEKIDGNIWLMAWAFMILVWSFCIYWTFAWALANGGVTMASWSYQIIFVLIQDCFVNETLQVIFIHVIAIEALRPQLKRIYDVLQQILKEKICLQTSKKTQEEQEKAWEFCVAQHLSASCRAARRPELHYLPFAQLLMRITDYDVAQCRDDRGLKLSGFLVGIFAIPTFLALTHEAVQDMILDVIVPTLWSCFVIANAYLFELGIWPFIAVYILMILVLAYRHFVVLPRKRKRKVERVFEVEEYKYDTKENLMWQNMNRQLQLVHMNTLNVEDFNPLLVDPKSHSVPSEISPKHDHDEESVISEITAPMDGNVAVHSDKFGKRRGGVNKYDEVSVGRNHPLPAVVVPLEIMQLHNPSAREEFINSHKKEKEKSLLGMATVSKLLGVAHHAKMRKHEPLQTRCTHSDVEMSVSSCEVSPAPSVHDEISCQSSVNEHDNKPTNNRQNLQYYENHNSDSSVSTTGSDNVLVGKGKKKKAMMSLPAVLSALKYDSTKGLSEEC